MHLSLLKNELKKPFIVLNGDILTKLHFGDFYKWSSMKNAPLTVCTKTIVTPFSFGNVSVDDNDNIIKVEEKPDIRTEIIAGVYFISPIILNLIPNNKFFGMDSLIQQLLQNNFTVARFPIQDYWIDIGQIDDYSRAQKEYSKHFEVKNQ